MVLKDAAPVSGTPREWPHFPGSQGIFDPMLGNFVVKDLDAFEPRYELYFTEPFPPEEAPAPGGLYAFGVRGREVLDLVITNIQPQQDLSAVLTCVEYSPEIFRVDDPGFTLPPFDGKITPVSGAVDSGAVSSDRYRLFSVYHDGEDEPPRPSGDGQSGGWHYAHTFRSVWQSSKMAEAVDRGEWGAPARVKAERGGMSPIT